MLEALFWRVRLCNFLAGMVTSFRAPVLVLPHHWGINGERKAAAIYIWFIACWLGIVQGNTFFWIFFTSLSFLVAVVRMVSLAVESLNIIINLLFKTYGWGGLAAHVYVLNFSHIKGYFDKPAQRLSQSYRFLCLPCCCKRAREGMAFDVKNLLNIAALCLYLLA